MKRLIFTLLLLSAACSASYAQRFRAGVRAGANMPDYMIAPLTAADGTLRSGDNRPGFEAAIVGRLKLVGRLHLQAEFEYDRVSCGYRYAHAGRRDDIRVKANRMDVPVTLGVDLGLFRLFGGASFRVAHNEKSTAPSLLTMRFNDPTVALTGGFGVNIRKFFLEGRLTGYPKKSLQTAVVEGVNYTVAARRNLMWSFSAGILF